MQPSFREFFFPENETWQAEVIDTWNMKIENRGMFSGRVRVELSGRPYMAVRLTRVDQR